MATSKKGKLREKDNEAHLIKVAKRHGGVAEKFTSPNRRSVPDRICTIPCWEPPIQFVEVKAEGEVATDAQQRDHDRRRAMGSVVHVVDTKQLVDDLFFFQCTNPEHKL